MEMSQKDGLNSFKRSINFSTFQRIIYRKLISIVTLFFINSINEVFNRLLLVFKFLLNLYRNFIFVYFTFGNPYYN